MKRPINSSTWISEVLYKSTPDSNYLAIFLSSEPVALLYRGVPSQIPGLLQAGLGGLSVGKAYNKLVKGKYEYNRVEGIEKVNQLRKMMVIG